MIQTDYTNCPNIWFKKCWLNIFIFQVIQAVTQTHHPKKVTAKLPGMCRFSVGRHSQARKWRPKKRTSYGTLMAPLSRPFFPSEK